MGGRWQSVTNLMSFSLGLAKSGWDNHLFKKGLPCTPQCNGQIDYICVFMQTSFLFGFNSALYQLPENC